MCFYLCCRDLLHVRRNGHGSAHEDPRRLFREIMQGLYTIAHRALVSSWSALRSYSVGLSRYRYRYSVGMSRYRYA